MGKLYWLPPLILQTLAWPPVRFLFHVFCRLEIRGREHLGNLPPGGIIFAANHASELDPILVRACLPLFGRFTPLFYGSLPAEFFQNGFGWRSFLYGNDLFLKSWGSYPLYRGLYDFEKALSLQTALLKDGRALLMFPEGGRAKDGILRKGKPGVAFLAHRTGVPVVPVAVKSTFGLTSRRFLLRKQKINVVIGAPYFVSRGKESELLPYDIYKEEAQKIMNEIQALYNASS